MTGAPTALSPLGYAAFSYAEERGWPVFPVLPGQKVPAVPGGFKAATTDLSQIVEWWSEWPTANIGFCPADAGLLVLDIDVKNANGFATLYELELANSPLPPTYTVRTPSGGEHRYFKGTAPSSVCRLGPGLDVRSRGGYVLLPPSIVDGKVYEVVA